MSFTFFRLPTDICADIYSLWLDIFSLSSFDVALMNKKHKTELKVACKFVFISCRLIGANKEILAWCKKRYFIIDSLVLRTSDKEEYVEPSDAKLSYLEVTRSFPLKSINLIPLWLNTGSLVELVLESGGLCAVSTLSMENTLRKLTLSNIDCNNAKETKIVKLFVSKLNSLEQVTFSDGKVTEGFVEVLKSVKENVEIEIRNFAQFHLAVEHHKNIKNVVVWGADMLDPLEIDDIAIKLLFQQAPQLHSLSIQYCFNVSGETMLQCVQSLTQLKHLSIAGCNLDHDALLTMFDSTNCVRNIVKLDLSETVTDQQILTKISKKCPQLVTFMVDYCRFVKPQGMLSVAKNCKALRHLSVRGAYKSSMEVDAYEDGMYTDSHLLSFLPYCTYLKELDISHQSLLTDAAMHALLHYCSRLTVLKMVKCTQITIEPFLHAKPPEFLPICCWLRYIDIVKCEKHFTDAAILQLRREFIHIFVYHNKTKRSVADKLRFLQNI